MGKKISQLYANNPATLPLAGDELIELVQSGVSKATPVNTLPGGSLYLVYTALLSQAGTNAPVPIILQNTFTNAITPSYSGGVGVYFFSCDDFIVGKTFAIISNKLLNRYGVDVTSEGIVSVSTYNSSGVAANDRLDYTPFEIRVYP